ncbi:transferase [Schizophyllum commune]
MSNFVMDKGTRTRDASVKITSQHTIACAHDEALNDLPSPFPLGPFDQLAVHYLPVTVIFVYDIARSSGDDPVSVPRLQQAFSRLLDYYPHLTGRRRIDPTDGTVAIDHLGSGAALYTAECDAPLDAFRTKSPDGQTRLAMSDLPGAGVQLLAASESMLEGASDDPLLIVQHTRFACGSVSLGVCLQHIMCDVNGCVQLARDLAEIYRGIGVAEAVGGTYLDVVLKEAPCIQAHIPEKALGSSLPELVNNYEVETGIANDVLPTAPPPPVVGKILRFSGKELKALKDAATDEKDGGWVSTFEALSAHLWQCVHRARTKLDPSRANGSGETLDTCSDLLAPVNCRSRLKLPARYFPNAILCPIARLSFRTLENASLAEIARTLHDMVQDVTPERAEGTLRHILTQPDKGIIKHRYRHGLGSFAVSAWNKVDMYGVSFGGNANGEPIAPVLVSPPYTPINLVDGLAFYLATESSHGSDEVIPPIDVSLTLHAPIWEVLEKDSNFRKFKQ